MYDIFSEIIGHIALDTLRTWTKALLGIAGNVLDKDVVRNINFGECFCLKYIYNHISFGTEFNVETYINVI